MSLEPEVEQRIMQENAGLIRYLVNRTLRLYPHLPGGFEREDLECYGRIGLLTAARTYDASRGVAFSTYAYKCIQNQIVSALERARTSEIECTSLQILLGEDGDTPLEDQIPDSNVNAEEAVMHRADREWLLKAIQQLDPQSARIVRSVYYQDMPISEVARMLRLSRHRAHALHAKALKKLRRRLHSEWRSQ